MRWVLGYAVLQAIGLAMLLVGAYHVGWWPLTLAGAWSMAAVLIVFTVKWPLPDVSDDADAAPRVS